jgi:glutaconate CoA-transferase subunit A
MLGTDTFTHSGAKVEECPFTGKPLVLLPALYPDVAVIHVHEADVYGNARVKGIMVMDGDLSKAAKHLILTTERLISNDEIRRDPTGTSIPYYLVDAVCEVRYGGYPGTMAYEYFSDEEHLQEWLSVQKNEEGFREFLKYNIYDCSDHYEYVSRHGGIEKMNQLRQKELLLHREISHV